MVNVYTNNGQFNITESLMEAIKANNPDILLEKETSKDFENRAVDASFNELLKFSVSYVLSELEVGSMKPEDFENFSKNMMNYYSMPKSPEKTHLKAKIKSFLHDVNEKNGTELNFNDIENTIKTEFKDNQTKMKNYSKEDALKFFADWQQKIAEKSIELEKQEKEEERQRDEDKYFRKHNISNSDDQILFQQILLHGGDISDGIEINGKKLTQKQIEKRIKRNPYFKKEWDKFQENEKAQKEISANSKEIEKTENEASILNKDYEPKTLEELLNAQRLIDEINVIESSAKKLVITAKESISSILGLFGNTQRNTSSNLKKNVPVNDNNQQVSLKKAANESLESDDYMLNEDDSYIPLTAVNDNTMDSYKSNKTGLVKKFGAFGALATGGFNLKPLFNGSVEDKKNFGICMKYYKEYTPSENKKSLVDNLMEYLILKHSNIDMFNDNIKEETIKLHPDLKNSKRKINEVIQKLSVDLDNISAKFLSNVVYKLEIGNDNTFNEILRAVRFAPKLKERYDIRNESKLQIFGIREQALIFQDSNIKSVVGIFISIPLLAKATELAKQAMKLGRHFKNIKA